MVSGDWETVLQTEGEPTPEPWRHTAAVKTWPPSHSGRLEMQHIHFPNLSLQHGEVSFTTDANTVLLNA